MTLCFISCDMTLTSILVKPKFLSGIITISTSCGLTQEMVNTIRITSKHDLDFTPSSTKSCVGVTFNCWSLCKQISWVRLKNDQYQNGQILVFLRNNLERFDETTKRLNYGYNFTISTSYSYLFLFLLTT